MGIVEEYENHFRNIGGVYADDSVACDGVKIVQQI